MLVSRLLSSFLAYYLGSFHFCLAKQLFQSYCPVMPKSGLWEIAKAVVFTGGFTNSDLLDEDTNDENA